MTSKIDSRLDMRQANMFLGRWPPKIADSVRNMRQIRNGSGVCFDIYSDHFERFIDNYEHIAERESLDFHVEKCNELPDCIEEGEFSANWRNNNDDYDGGFGGMRRQQSYQPNYGGGGNYRGGRGRGGYDRRDDGYGNSRGRGGGGWDRQGGSYYDRDNGNNYDQPHFQKSNSYSGGGGGYGRGTRGGYQGGNNNYYGDRDNRSGYSNNNYQQQQSHEQQKPTTSVFVSGLGSQFNDQKLKEAFQNQKLNVVRARVLYGQDGESKGSGFVELANHDEAQQAVNKVNGQVIEGRKLMVQFSKN